MGRSCLCGEEERCGEAALAKPFGDGSGSVVNWSVKKPVTTSLNLEGTPLESPAPPLKIVGQALNTDKMGGRKA